MSCTHKRVSMIYTIYELLSHHHITIQWLLNHVSHTHKRVSMIYTMYELLPHHHIAIQCLLNHVSHTHKRVSMIYTMYELHAATRARTRLREKLSVSANRCLIAGMTNVKKIEHYQLVITYLLDCQQANRFLVALKTKLTVYTNTEYWHKYNICTHTYSTHIIKISTLYIQNKTNIYI